ncbi:MAG TPA: thiamine pyrophosphate-binding protein, partial [Pseudomonadales bacterium]|nr:thiamine pyrophosphate-binding protein [Pseudomonadales bacterium]
MQLADAIVSVLRDLELRYVFGVSGANIEHIHDALHRLGHGKIKSVMTKSEYGAAFMADARARVHRTLGVCCSTSGGGMMNLAVGIAESYAQEVPVLALVGQPPLAVEGRGGFQDSSGKSGALDGVGFWNSIAKWVCKMDSPALFWTQFAKAITTPFEGRQGPSVLLLPRDMMTMEVGEKPDWFPTRLPDMPPTTMPGELISDLWASLQSAKNPVFILGSGVIRHGAENLACQLMLESGITVASTLASPGIFPNDLKNYLGMIGVAGHPSAHQYIHEHADLIIAVGTKLCAMTRGNLDVVLAQKNLWIINGDSSEIDPALRPTRIIETNLKSFFQDLIELQSHFPLYKRLPANLDVTCFVPTKVAYAARKIKSGAIGRGSLTQSEAIHCLNAFLPE